MSFNQDFTPSTGQVVQVTGFGRRFVAFFIDTIILSIVGGCLGAVIGNEDPLSTVNLAARCLVFLIGVAYFVGFWATTGQTLGKMAMGIKVIGTDGLQITLGKAILRCMGYIGGIIVLGIGFIWITFDKRRQGWHDKIAGTYVVRKDTNFSPTGNVTFTPSDPGGGVTIAILAAVFFILIPICVIAILLLLGPVVGNVFSNIVQNLETPSPH